MKAASSRDLVDVTTRLHTRFGDRYPLVEILDVVDSCRRDLDLATTEGLPELVERLATQRLIDRIGADEVVSAHSA